MTKYTKICKENTVFFIQDIFLPVPNNIRAMLLKSDIAIDTRSNTVIKCKYSLDDIMTFFLENKNV